MKNKRKNVRETALEILETIEKNQSYSNLLLNNAINKNEIDKKDHRQENHGPQLRPKRSAVVSWSTRMKTRFFIRYVFLASHVLRHPRRTGLSLQPLQRAHLEANCNEGITAAEKIPRRGIAGTDFPGHAGLVPKVPLSRLSADDWGGFGGASAAQDSWLA